MAVAVFVAVNFNLCAAVQEEKETLLKELNSAKSQLNAALLAVETACATSETTKQHMSELEEQLAGAR